MSSMNIALVGSGGREHALAWKIRQSPHCGNLYILPGNAGTSFEGTNVPIHPTDVPKIIAFCKEKAVHLLVVGPEAALGAGVVDAARAHGILAYGPTRAAAQLELSKAFSKDIMRDARVPTAPYRAFSDFREAEAHLRARPMPCMVKASGNAAGKGARVCKTLEAALAAAREFMVEHSLGNEGKTVVIEDYMPGIELSTHFLCQGRQFRPTVVTMDHKWSHDFDQGEMTGGMGAVGPITWLNAGLSQMIKQHVVRPTLRSMDKRGAPFRGTLYPGLMLTKDGVFVLEFNARFGDPETQVLMLLLKSDLLPYLLAVADGTLFSLPELEWHEGLVAVCVVLCAPGYPNAYQMGIRLHDVARVCALPHVRVFHAGTVYDGGVLTSAGGRVLCVCATGSNIVEARVRAYAAVAQVVSVPRLHFRTDIGLKALEPPAFPAQ